jgi:flagellar motor switch/type III secretory pathway protein FliN
MACGIAIPALQQFLFLKISNLSCPASGHLLAHSPGMTPETQSSSDKTVSQPDPVVAEGVATLAVTQEDSEERKFSLAGLAAKLPLQLDLRVPLPTFRVQQLLSLEKGQVIETVWPHTEDLPLWSGGVQLVWTEFEVVDQKLAVRVTRLA